VRLARSPWGPTSFWIGTKDREDDHGEKVEGEEVEEETGEEESRAGEKEKDNKVREEGGAEEEGCEKGGTQAQGAGEKARSRCRSCSDSGPRPRARGSVMERAHELGYRRQQQQQLDALLLSEAAKKPARAPGLPPG
jgi:hypothetical protein